uniref:hypothetical protein n=1 Tax=Roseburia hominis TaxID=301301 RepID=UPI003FF0D13B
RDVVIKGSVDRNIYFDFTAFPHEISKCVSNNITYHSKAVYVIATILLILDKMPAVVYDTDS